MAENKLDTTKITDFSSEVSAQVGNTVQDSLSVTDTDKPLSANQGKVLNDKKIDAVVGATVGNLAIFTSTGSLEDSGKSTSFTDFLPGFIEIPTARVTAYPITIGFPYTALITQIVVSCGSSDLEVNFRVNGNDIFSSNYTVTTSQDTIVNLQNNVLNPGDRLELFINSVSVGVEDFSYTIIYNRELI